MHFPSKFTPVNYLFNQLHEVIQLTFHNNFLGNKCNEIKARIFMFQEYEHACYIPISNYKLFIELCKTKIESTEPRNTTIISKIVLNPCHCESTQKYGVVL